MAYHEVLPDLPEMRCDAVQLVLRDWLQQGGAGLLAAERDMLRGHLPCVAGEYAVQLGLAQITWLPEDSRLRRIWLDIAEDGVEPYAPRRLSLSSGSVDMAVMPHVLESVAQPELVLREVSRILAPGGSILLFMLAPCRQCPWPLPSRALPLARLRRTLGWLECEIVCCKKVLVAAGSSSWQKLWPGLSGNPWSWFIHARHSVPGFTAMPYRDKLRRGQKADPLLSAGRSAGGLW